MRTALHRAVLLAALAALALPTGCASPGSAQAAHLTAAESVAAADALDRQFLAAFNKGDLDALMALFWKSPDLVSIGLDGMGSRGWDAVRAAWDATLTSMPGAKLSFPEMHNAAVGEAVLGWGRWKMSVPVGQAEQLIEGRYSDAKALRDGRWVYLMDHGSVPIPSAK